MAVTSQQQRGIRITLTVIVAVVAVLLGLLVNKLLSPRILTPAELSVNGAVVFDKPRVIRPFQLVDQDGEEFGLPQLKGKWSLLFFGFTACPDICPATLSVLSRWHETLDEDLAEKTNIVLVSVDPARDTPEQLQEYLKHFQGDAVGVTGEFLQVKRFTDNLNVAFNKVTLDDTYTVDHSSFVVLVNPYGHYHAIFRSPIEKDRLTLTYQSIVESFDH